MRAALRVAVGNDIPPVKGFALRDEGEEGFVRMIGLEFMQFELEFYKYILVCGSCSGWRGNYSQDNVGLLLLLLQ